MAEDGPRTRNVSASEGDGVLFIGEMREYFDGTKLPNTRETLQVFFYHHKILQKTVTDSARDTVRLVTPFWTEKSRIPILREDFIIAKLKKLFEEWILVKKNHTRQSSAQVQRVTSFQEKLDILFDIAVSNALEIMENEEDKVFLIGQRKPEREGRITTVRDNVLAFKEKEAEAKKVRAEERRIRHEKYKAAYYQSIQNQQDSKEVDFLSSCSSEEEGKNSDGETESHSRRGRINILTPAVTITCDAIGLSSRNAAAIISSTAHALGHDLTEINVNYSSIHRKRQSDRKIVSKKVKTDFIPDKNLTLHWDGKIVLDLIGKQNVDRIAIVLTGVTSDQLLEIPKINSGTGLAIAEAVFAVLESWELGKEIKALSFDTTSVNTGMVNGAAVLLQELLAHLVLFLACRHHILELLLEAVYIVHLSPSGGPDIIFFKKFQQHWPMIDTTRFRNGLKEKKVLEALGTEIDNIIQFAEDQIKMFQPRNDYRELLNLTIMFLGGVPVNGFTFMAPEAFNKTRWMSKAINALKIWMLRDQFPLTKDEQN